MKVVDLVARIPEHLDLHFSDFSTILYGIYKFAVLKTKEKGQEILHLDPWTSISSQHGSLADGTVQGRFGRPFSGEVRPRRRGGSWGKG